MLLELFSFVGSTILALWVLDRMLSQGLCIYLYIYIYYVPATKLCNKDEFSLKMLRRTIKVFYIYIYIARLSDILLIV